MRIHVSEATAVLLEGTNFVVEKRGEMEVKVLVLLWLYIIRFHASIHATIG